MTKERIVFWRQIRLKKAAVTSFAERSD